VATRRRLRRLVESEWGIDLIRGWDRWISLATDAGDVIATLIDAAPGEVVVADSTSVNLYKLAAAALDARPGRRVIVTDDDNFPTDRYVLAGLADARGYSVRTVKSNMDDGVSTADVAPALDRDTALVSLSHVAYRSGAIADLPGITAAAHEAGALALWDLSHSVGSVPVPLTGAGVDLAVGCTYKHINGGPGAPAFLYVRTDLQSRLRQPIWGWFGQRDQFAMGPRYEPTSGIERFMAGTPSVLGLTAVDAGVELILEAGVERVQDKALALTELVVALHDERLAPLGLRLNTPRVPSRRGAHISLGHDEGWRLCRALIERADVIPDFRPPDTVRLGFAPLYSRFVDVWDAVDRLARLVETGEYREVEARPARVT
jgi:kynureninase